MFIIDIQKIGKWKSVVIKSNSYILNEYEFDFGLLSDIEYKELIEDFHIAINKLGELNAA